MSNQILNLLKSCTKVQGKGDWITVTNYWGESLDICPEVDSVVLSTSGQSTRLNLVDFSGYSYPLKNEIGEYLANFAW